MNVSRIALAIAVGGVLSVAQSASAQHHHHHRNHYTPNYHIDHHDHVVRDGHGHVIGRYHHDVIHQNSTYVVPHTSHTAHHGTYHVHNNRYYYTPQTASIANQHVVAKPAVVQFGSFSHVDDLAARLETLTNEFLLDLHYNYPHNPGFRETYAEAYQLLEVAKYIHAAEHQHDRRAIQSKLNGMDALFHHIQDDVRGWSRHHHHQVGQLGILSKMDMIESALHHLMNDVGVQQAPPPGSVGGQAPPPGGVAPGPLTTAPPPATIP
ncbi:MAG: hypothetical protein KDA89_00415 [Planctomycetaceae bacterium]|nr:hypothetical protein [Planctomycetaceae bacterium]MCA9047157.1 hypothetical protein [Planctomycetaceae bacterium]